MCPPPPPPRGQLGTHGELVDIGNPNLSHLGSEFNVNVDWASAGKRTSSPHAPRHRMGGVLLPSAAADKLSTVSATLSNTLDCGFRPSRGGRLSGGGATAGSHRSPQAGASACSPPSGRFSRVLPFSMRGSRAERAVAPTDGTDGGHAEAADPVTDPTEPEHEPEGSLHHAAHDLAAGENCPRGGHT